MPQRRQKRLHLRRQCSRQTYLQRRGFHQDRPTICPHPPIRVPSDVPGTPPARPPQNGASSAAASSTAASPGATCEGRGSIRCSDEGHNGATCEGRDSICEDPATWRPFQNHPLFLGTGPAVEAPAEEADTARARRPADRFRIRIFFSAASLYGSGHLQRRHRPTN